MNIAIFARTWPRHNISAAQEHTISLVETLINLNNQVTLCSDEANFELKTQLKEYPMDMLDISPNKISASLNALNKQKQKPNLFIFDSFETEQKYSAFLYNRWNKVPRVLSICELPGLSRWRRNSYKMIPNCLLLDGSPLAPDKLDDTFSLEQVRSIHRSDYIFAGNQYLHFLLNKHFFASGAGQKDKPSVRAPCKYMSLLNYGFPINEYCRQISRLEYRPFRNRQHFVYLGSFDRESSQDSAYQLVTYIWPGIRKMIPNAQLHIYGTSEDKGITYERFLKGLPSATVKHTKPSLNKQGIFVKGVLQKSEQLSSYKAMLYPCVFSSSSHLKVIQSWFNHLPVVTTPIGAEGLFLQAPDPFYCAPVGAESDFSFISERTFSKAELESASKINEYYQKNLIRTGIGLTFGGSYQNLTYKSFIENSVKLYSDEKYWNYCLASAQNIIKSKHTEQYMEILLKKAFVSIQIATYEGRGKPNYEQQWKRYTKSPEFNKKIRA